jgi:hypothetical protein
VAGFCEHCNNLCNVIVKECVIENMLIPAGQRFTETHVGSIFMQGNVDMYCN